MLTDNRENAAITIISGEDSNECGSYAEPDKFAVGTGAAGEQLYFDTLGSKNYDPGDVGADARFADTVQEQFPELLRPVGVQIHSLQKDEAGGAEAG